jgi:hypothetical protein
MATRSDISITKSDETEEVQVTRTEAFKPVHFTRIQGDVCPPGSPSYVPSRVKGAADLAEKTKPSITTKLQDEYGSEVEQKFDYYQSVGSAKDLRDNFHPDRVVELGRGAKDPRHEIGVLLRLRTKQAALDDMIAMLQEWELPRNKAVLDQFRKGLPAMKKALLDEVARLDKEIASLQKEQFFKKSLLPEK